MTSCVFLCPKPLAGRYQWAGVGKECRWGFVVHPSGGADRATKRYAKTRLPADGEDVSIPEEGFWRGGGGDGLAESAGAGDLVVLHADL